MTNTKQKSISMPLMAALFGASIAFAAPATANGFDGYVAPAVAQADDANLLHQANFKFKVSKGFGHRKFGHKKFGHGKFGHSKFGHGKFGHGKFGHGKVVKKKVVPHHGFGKGAVVFKSGKGFVVKHPGFKPSFVVKKKFF